AIRYSPLPTDLYDNPPLETDPRAENATYVGRFGADPLRYTDEVRESETVKRGIGGLRLIGQLTPFLSVETSIGGNYERKGGNSYFPRTVYEGRNANGLAIVTGSEVVQLGHDDLV